VPRQALVEEGVVRRVAWQWQFLCEWLLLRDLVINSSSGKLLQRIATAAVLSNPRLYRLPASARSPRVRGAVRQRPKLDRGLAGAEDVVGDRRALGTP
jgi:hypothetical protein